MNCCCCCHYCYSKNNKQLLVRNQINHKTGCSSSIRNVADTHTPAYICFSNNIARKMKRLSAYQANVLTVALSGQSFFLPTAKSKQTIAVGIVTFFWRDFLQEPSIKLTNRTISSKILSLKRFFKEKGKQNR